MLAAVGIPFNVFGVHFNIFKRLELDLTVYQPQI
jgi:hypothetical protein